jgi:hypothetical protein
VAFSNFLAGQENEVARDDLLEKVGPSARDVYASERLLRSMPNAQF